MSLEFKPFPKIGRLKRDCTITEKVDGSNGLLAFSDEGEMLVGSRKRQIFPNGTEGMEKGCDNFGFAHWAYEHQEALFEYLGMGYHYGEWAGMGIQRGYGIPKQFFLFNTFRNDDIPAELSRIGLQRVPVLYQGGFDSSAISEVMDELKAQGSCVGSAEPEGIIVYHHAAKEYFKLTYKHDRMGKPT